MKKMTAGLFALVLAGQASAYQIEGDAQIRQLENHDAFSVGGTYYLQDVNQTSGPFAEAAFIEKASFVGAHYYDLESNNTFYYNLESNNTFYYDLESNNTFGIQGRYVLQDTGFFVNGEALFGSSNGGFQLGGGLYLDSSATAEVFLMNTDYLDSFGAKYKQLVYRNDGTYLNLEAGLTRFSYNNESNGLGLDTDETEAMVGGDYYLNKAVSLGADLSVFFGDNDGEQLTLKGQHFIRQNIAFNAGIIFSDREYEDSDVGFQLGAIARF